MEYRSVGVMAYETNLRNQNRGYMKLIVWQKAMNLFELVWAITFIESKIGFKLRSQVVDAAQSVSANIAEGHGRRSAAEYIQFLYYSLGSLAETMTRAIGLRQTKQITEERFQELDVLHYEVENRLLRLIEKIEAKRDTGDWTARIAEDAEEYDPDPLLQHSLTPTLHS